MKFILAYYYYYYCTVLANLLSTSFHVGIIALKSIIVIQTNKLSSQLLIETAIGRYDISLLYMQTRNC